MNRRSFFKFLGAGLVASLATRAAQARVCERNVGTLRAIYPVGAIYISTVNTNPSDLFGFGTWQAFGAGRTLVGVQTGDAEFGTVQATGGARTHTLTTAEMPSHNHPFTNSTGRIGYFWGQRFESNGALSFADTVLSSLSGGSPGNSIALCDFNLANGGFAINNSGSGAAHNNLPPYITVYMWRRTS